MKKILFCLVLLALIAGLPIVVACTSDSQCPNPLECCDKASDTCRISMNCGGSGGGGSSPGIWGDPGNCGNQPNNTTLCADTYNGCEENQCKNGRITTQEKPGQTCVPALGRCIETGTGTEPTGTECMHECHPQGEKYCIGTDRYRECGNYDPDNCLEWKETPCNAEEPCNSATGDCEAIPECEVSLVEIGAGLEFLGSTSHDKTRIFSYPSQSKKNQNLFRFIVSGGDAQVESAKLKWSYGAPQELVLGSPPFITLAEARKAGKPFECEITLKDGTKCYSKPVYIQFPNEDACDRQNELEQLYLIENFGKELKILFEGKEAIEILRSERKTIGTGEKTMHDVSIPITSEGEQIGNVTILSPQNKQKSFDSLQKEIVHLVILMQNLEDVPAFAQETSGFAATGFFGNGFNITIILEERIPCKTPKSQGEKPKSSKKRPSILDTISKKPQGIKCMPLEAWAINKHGFDSRAIGFPSSFPKQLREKILATIGAEPSAYIITKDYLLGMEPAINENAKSFVEKLFDEIQRNQIEIYRIPEEHSQTGICFADYVNGKILISPCENQPAPANTKNYCYTLPENIGKYASRSMSENERQTFIHEATHMLDTIDFLKGQLGENYDPRILYESDICEVYRSHMKGMEQRVTAYYQYQSPYVRFQKPENGPYATIKIDPLAATEFNARSIITYYKILKEGSGTFYSDTQNVTYLKNAVLSIRKSYSVYILMDTGVEIISTTP